MKKILISVPDKLAVRIRATIPPGQRSKTITHLLEEEVARREESLYQCALEVEDDSKLNEEMRDWDITLNNGIEDESW